MSNNNFSFSRSESNLSLLHSSSSKLPQTQSRHNSLPDNYLMMKDIAYHYKIKGELIFDIEKGILKWIRRGDKNEDFKDRYNNENQDEIMIIISDVVDLMKHDDDKSKRYLIKIDTANYQKGFIFSFQEENKDNEKIRNKYFIILKDGFLKYYKNEFLKYPIKLKKKISFLMNNKDLLILFKKLLKMHYFEAEKIYQYIRILHPDRININLGQGRIQLSRDEELIMFTQKKYNINKLISSDSYIERIYYNEMEQKQFNKNESWNKFINNQKDNKTYLVGHYKPILPLNKENQEINNNNLFEELEKDKYYYNDNESNYLYYNEDTRRTSYDTLFSEINSYSINKMKEINYFSFSPICINIYNNKNQIKNKLRRSISSEIKMEIEETNDMNSNNNSNKKLSKSDLLDKLNKMEEEYKNKNDAKKMNKSDKNFDNKTKKIIVEEMDKIYDFTKIMNSMNYNADDLKDIYQKIFMIKDLSFVYKIECIPLKNKIRDGKMNPKKYELIEKKLKEIKSEMKSIYDQLLNEIRTKRYFAKEFLMQYVRHNTII